MLASASWDATPRVGIVLSSLRGSTEHDGTTIAGLADPRPVDSKLTPVQLTAMVRKAMELGSRSRGGAVRPRRGPPSEDWLVVLVSIQPDLQTDPTLVEALLEDYAAQDRGRRFTIAAGAPAPSQYQSLIQALRTRHKRPHFDYVDLAQDAYLEVPAARRTFAARNPEGIYAVSKTIRECDRLITIAPLRTSPNTVVSLTTANYWDITPSRNRLLPLGHPVDLLTDLYLHHPADYAILGGSIHRDEAGSVHHNIVIAGTNAVAVDSIGAAVMGFDPHGVPLLDKLEARGFGVCDPNSIWTRGNEVDEAKRQFKGASNA